MFVEYVAEQVVSVALSCGCSFRRYSQISQLINSATSHRDAVFSLPYFLQQVILDPIYLRRDDVDVAILWRIELRLGFGEQDLLSFISIASMVLLPV